MALDKSSSSGAEIVQKDQINAHQATIICHLPIGRPMWHVFFHLLHCQIKNLNAPFHSYLNFHTKWKANFLIVFFS